MREQKVENGKEKVGEKPQRGIKMTKNKRQYRRHDMSESWGDTVNKIKQETKIISSSIYFYNDSVITRDRL